MLPELLFWIGLGCFLVGAFHVACDVLGPLLAGREPRLVRRPDPFAD